MYSSMEKGSSRANRPRHDSVEDSERLKIDTKEDDEDPPTQLENHSMLAEKIKNEASPTAIDKKTLPQIKHQKSNSNKIVKFNYLQKIPSIQAEFLDHEREARLMEKT